MKDISRVNVGTIGHVDYAMQLSLAHIHRSTLTQHVLPGARVLYTDEVASELLTSEERAKRVQELLANGESTVYPVPASIIESSSEDTTPSVREPRRKKRTKAKSRIAKESRRKNRNK